MCRSSWRPRLPCPTPSCIAPLLVPLCCCSLCRPCRRCPGPGCSSAACRSCRLCCCCPRPLTTAVLPPLLNTCVLWCLPCRVSFPLPRSWSLRSHVRRVLHVRPRNSLSLASARSPVSVLALPRLVPTAPFLKSPLACACVLHVQAPRFPVLGLGDLAVPFLVVSVMSYLVVVSFHVSL